MTTKRGELDPMDYCTVCGSLPVLNLDRQPIGAVCPHLWHLMDPRDRRIMRKLAAIHRREARRARDEARADMRLANLDVLKQKYPNQASSINTFVLHYALTDIPERAWREALAGAERVSQSAEDWRAWVSDDPAAERLALTAGLRGAPLEGLVRNLATNPRTKRREAGQP